MPHYQLVSQPLCPYVQRCAIVLEEKGLLYDVRTIDLEDKPDWFRELSPLGKVPVLVVDGEVVLFESSIISEYLDEAGGEPFLHPTAPLGRAYHRGWIVVGDGLLKDVWRLSTAVDEASAREASHDVRVWLGRFEGQLRSGSYFGGERFSLIDAALAPALQRIEWCVEIAPSLELFADLPRVRDWKAMLLQRDSVRRSTPTNVRELFAESLKGRSGAGRRPDSWLGTQM